MCFKSTTDDFFSICRGLRRNTWDLLFQNWIVAVDARCSLLRHTRLRLTLVSLELTRLAIIFTLVCVYVLF